MNAEQKAEFVSMAKRHYELDILLRGTYGFDYFHPHQGCSVGCFNNDLNNDPNDHKSLADHFGLPVWLVELQDFSFEAVGKGFHVKFAESLPVTTDWHPVYCAIFGRILRDIVLPRAGSSQLHVEKVLLLCDQCSTEKKEWDAVSDAAMEAAIAAWDAANGAAMAAASSAAMAAASSAAMAAASDAETRRKIARIVLEELKAAQS